MLLVCAAIGVATGMLGGIAGWVTVPVIAGPAFLYGLVLGSHVLPGIIAQEVLRRPLVALITHVIAALIASAFNPAWTMRFLGTALLFGAIQEGVAALTRYRAWGAWRFLVSAALIGVIVAVVVYFAVDLSVRPAWEQIAYLVISVLGPVAWTAVGLGIGSALNRAGVARR
ncbi:MAG: ECF transporter S component [Microbacterium sp.]|nr:ECF transporter S component [Microbacterium sp.]